MRSLPPQNRRLNGSVHASLSASGSATSYTVTAVAELSEKRTLAIFCRWHVARRASSAWRPIVDMRIHIQRTNTRDRAASLRLSMAAAGAAILSKTLCQSSLDCHVDTDLGERGSAVRLNTV